eukprot:scaffold57452_cov28-Tisochrysis_lutea.AAC.1
MFSLALRCNAPLQESGTLPAARGRLIARTPPETKRKCNGEGFHHLVLRGGAVANWRLRRDDALHLRHRVHNLRDRGGCELV